MTAAGPAPLVRVWDLQDRRGQRPTRNPWVVRWKIDNHGARSRGFPTRALAEDFRARLLLASRNGEPFDATGTGLPVSWARPDMPSLAEFARQWVARQIDWEPRTRRTVGEALARFLTACLRPGATELSAKDAAEARRWLRRCYLATEPVLGDLAARRRGPDVDEGRWERFFARWSPALDELDRQLLDGVEQLLRAGVDGQVLGSSGKRYVKIARQLVTEAVRVGLLTADPWPPAPAGRATRKAQRLARQRRMEPVLRVRPQEVERILAVMISHQPASRMYRVMTAVGFYAGLRPSEIRDLKGLDLDLPEAGWGTIRVQRADVGRAEPGEPKNGRRLVPIPPRLVSILRAWLEESGVGDGFLFRTRTGRRPTDSNHTRTLRRACVKAELDALTPYDMRRSCATFWDSAGVARAEIARRLGHSLDTLERFYLGVAIGDEDLGNRRIDALLDDVA